MNTEIKLTNIRLLTLEDTKDAVQVAEDLLAFCPEKDYKEYSKKLFAAISLQLIYDGYAEVQDVIEKAKAISKSGVIDFTFSKGTAATTWWIKRFNDHQNHDANLIAACAEDWQFALAQIEKQKQIEETGEHKHPAFKKIHQLAAARKNVLLVGPAGTGKTHAARQVADALGLDFASVSVTAGMSVSQLTGWLMPGGYLESDFVRLYENGGVFLLDEMDAADANTLTVINQAIANGSFNIAQRTGKSEIKKHPDFVCIAAANTFGTGGDMVYAGREQLDAATLDRFLTVFVDYDRRFEAKRCEENVLRFTHAVRAGIASLKLRRVMSTRKAIDFSDMVRSDSRWTLADCKECYFTGWSDDEKAKIAAFL